VIALLAGTLLEKAPSRLIIDVHGVGYHVQVPLSTFYVVGDPGAAISLRIHTHVREDVIALFGFATTVEQDLFERLIGISGIGPKLALAVLSGIEPPDLIKAIRLQDVARLTAIPGIGRKTAERIGLELKDRLPATMAASEQARAEVSRDDQLRDDLMSALLNLGYQRAVAEKAIEKVVNAGGELRFEQALKDVLRALMR
jgi:holliday junction DNA helicase RuvA